MQPTVARLQRRLRVAGAAASTVVLLSSCASVQAYARRNAEEACLGLDRCLVYDATGKHEVPCISTRHGAIYAGDPGWPFDPPDLCDRVLAARGGAQTTR
jgi:hypothetical protein